MVQTSYGTITITDTTDLEWFYGTGVLNGTGDSVNHQIVLTSNLINGAAVGSMYLDTQTSLVYKCIEVSDNSQTWQYVGNMTAGVQDEIEDASKVATNYLAVDETGIMVANMRENEYTPTSIINTNVNNVFIDSDSVNIRKGGDVLAIFGENVTIGEKDKSRIEFFSNNMIGHSGGGGRREFFNFAGEGGAQEDKTLKQEFFNDYLSHYNGPNQTDFFLNYVPRSDVWIEIKLQYSYPSEYNITQHQTGGMSSQNMIYIQSGSNPTGSIARFYFPDLEGDTDKQVIEGVETSNDWVGWTGYDVYWTPTGTYSGEGIPAIAEWKINLSYQENLGKITNIIAQLITNCAQAQEICRRYFQLSMTAYYKTSDPTPIFSFGNENKITGAYSMCIGTGLESNYSNQFILGEYNNNGNNFFEIGNGSYINRSNLFQITKTGNIQLGNISLDPAVDNSPRFDLLSSKGRMSVQTSANNTGIWDTTNGLDGYWLIAHRFDNDHAYIGKYLEVPNNAIIKGQKMVYDAGDVISYTGYVECAGRIAASGKTLAFQIPLTKPIASGRTLTLNTTNTSLAIYYYNGNTSETAISSISGMTSTNLSNISLTYSDCGIRVTIPKSTNWISSVNQTNLTAVLHNLSITVS